MKYAGMAFQILAVLGTAFFIGYKLDLRFATLPIFTILFPLVALAYLFYKIINETNSKPKK